MIRVGSLFAGIGGFDYGLQQTGGFKTAWVAEQHPYRRRVLARHFPDAQQFRDVRHVHPRTAGPVELVCGGFPCQDVSDAGRGAGIAGRRSGLWVQFARVIEQFQPRWVIIENTASLARRGLASVLRDLAAIGFDAEWDCIPAAAIGAPHQRDRIWIVAYPAASPDADEDRRVHDRDAQEDDEGPARARAGASGERRGTGRAGPGGGAHRDSGQAVVGVVADTESDTQRGGLRESGSSTVRRRRPRDGGGPRVFGDAFVGRIADAAPWTTEPRVGRVVDGLPDRVDRVEALGDSLVPQIVGLIGQAILDYEGTP